MKKSFTKTALTAVASGVLAVVLPVTALAYGPVEGAEGRKYFDYYDTSTYPNYPAFNSFKNSPGAGFEPDFMSIKKSTDPDVPASWNKYQDMVTLERGVTYDVYVYYHNNAPAGTNPSNNARIWVDFPALVQANTSIKGTANLSANNSTPRSIWSTLTFKATSDTLLSYVQGSAFIRYADNTTKTLPNQGKDLFTQAGQLIGRNLDGIVYGCDAQSGYIQFQIVADQPDFTVSKQVRINNDGTAKGGWVESVKAKQGDIVDFFIEYTNTGTIQQDNVVIKDVLPAGLEYIKNSTTLYNANYPTSAGGLKVVDGVVSSTGINIGNYAAGSNAFVTFSARVTSKSTTCDTIKNIAHAITANGSRSDDAIVELDNDCNPPVEKCEVPGKTHLDKNDPNCKEDEVKKPCTVPGKTHLAVDDPNCKEDEDKKPCTVPGKTHLPVDDPNCKPGELPKTGPASIVSGVIGLGSIATAGAYFIKSRKNLN